MVEFKVIFDNKINDKLSEIQTEKSKKGLKKLSSILYILSVVVAFIGFLEFENKFFFVCCMVFAVLNFVFWWGFPKLLIATIKKQQKKISKQNNMFDVLTEEVYKFDEERVFIFTTHGEKYRSAIETDYDYFYSVYEDDDCFVLYISEAQCHVIFKTDIKNGTISEFREMLLKHFSQDQYQRKIKIR